MYVCTVVQSVHSSARFNSGRSKSQPPGKQIIEIHTCDVCRDNSEQRASQHAACMAGVQTRMRRQARRKRRQRETGIEASK